MNRCTRCVLPDTRPDTAFVEGVCSACIAYAKRPTIDWEARREQFVALLARAKERSRALGLAYDCIVPSSGGKDSHAQVLKLIELGARPLVVTASTCHLTDIGRTNIENLKRYATTIEVSPNRSVRARLNRIGLMEVGDISWPEHVAIFTTPFKVACQTGIGLLFYGENPQSQYGGPLGSQDALIMTRRWVSEFGGFLGLRPSDLVGVQGLTQEDMADYLPPTDEDLEAGEVEAHFLGQYLPWDSHANARLASERGMVYARPTAGNWWTHENLDCSMTGIHDYGMYRKYGYGRGAAQISVDIRAGLIDRAEALRWVEENDGWFPYTYGGVYYENVIDRIGVKKQELFDALDRFTNWKIFDKQHRRADGTPCLRAWA
jgi:N-acetyl sugar amidotransferase